MFTEGVLHFKIDSFSIPPEKKVKESVTINSTLQSENQTLQSSQNTTLTNGVTQTLDNVKNEMDRVKLYQQRLLEKYKADLSNVESITLDQSSNIIVKEMDTEESITEDKSSKEGFLRDFCNLEWSTSFNLIFNSSVYHISVPMERCT